MTLKHFESNSGRPHSNALIRGTRVAKRATGSDPLTDDHQELWYGQISIGTPPVGYTVDFDTGSSDLFVPASSCRNCGNHVTYDPSKSTTSKPLRKKFLLQYGDGSSTSGTQYSDTVTVAGLTVTDQTLGAATNYSSQFQQGSSDGLMGLAFPAISSYPALPFFNSLIQENVVDAGQFSFYLSEAGSELFLGGSDKSHYTGTLNWNKVTHEGYWQIDMDSLEVSQNAAVSSLSVIIDSGTTLIVGDDANVKKFWAAVPGSKDASSTAGQGMYAFPCDSTAQISARFNGVSYTISPETLSFGKLSAGSNDCLGAIMAGNEGFWIMGDAFMQNVYTVFDFDHSRVGFAKLAQDELDEQ